VATAREEAGQWVAQHVGHVQQRPKRRRGGQRVAAAQHHAGPLTDGLAEAPREGALAGARLAGEQHDPSAAGRRLAHQCGELIQVRPTLDQVHAGRIMERRWTAE